MWNSKFEVDIYWTKRIVSAPRYQMQDFMDMCPVKRQLNDHTGSIEVCEWRNLGVLWGRLSGLTYKEIGSYINKSRGGLIINLKTAFNLFDQGDKSFMEKLERVKKYSQIKHSLDEKI